MKLQAKFALYNAITKIAVILVLGLIILLSMETISSHHLDTRLTKKRTKVIANLNDREIDSLLSDKKTFTDYNILKDEFIVLKLIAKNKPITKSIFFSTDHREIEGDIEVYRILNEKFEYNGKWYDLELGETMTALESIKATIRFYMLIVLVIAILITLITDYAFTNFILKPFYTIIDQKINKVNDPTEYNYANVPTNTTDFKTLDNSINSLMRKIADLFKIEKQFIANVSHELLTPISILSGRLENILTAENLPIEHENKIIASLKTLNRLKTIINSLLLISKVENEQYLKQNEVDLKQELTEIEEELEDRIAAKSILFHNMVSEGIIFKSNKALIHILLINIVNNAIKYNRNAGSIKIIEKTETEYYLICVEDSGIGMDQPTLKQMFRRFERENEDQEEGFGLGLAIVHSIAKFHGILLDVKSEKGTGTTFTIKFPIS